LSSRALERFVSRRNLLPPKYMRKVTWRLMVRAMPREVSDSYRATLES
jgi:hypothetical protein